MSIETLRAMSEYIAWFLLLIVFIAAVCWFGVNGAAQDTCELTCEPYVVEMCNRELAVCKTPDGFEVRKKRSKF